MQEPGYEDHIRRENVHSSYHCQRGETKKL